MVYFFDFCFNKMRVFHRIVILFATYLMLFLKNGHCCGPPEAPENGYFTPFKPKYGELEKVKYVCNAGFTLQPQQQPDTYVHCMNNRWTNPPSCVRNSVGLCGTPGIPDNGVYTINDANNNGVSYKCDAGHVLVGPSIRTCSRDESGSYWTPLEIPKCVTNLAYLALRTKMHMMDNDRFVADGDDTTCGFEYRSAIGLDISFTIYLQDKDAQFTDVIIKFKNGSKMAVELMAHNFTLDIAQTPLHLATVVRNNNNDANTPWSYNVRASGGSSRSQIAKYISIKTSGGNDYNNFSICEIQIFNSEESTGCGTPDTPSDGVALRLSSPDNSPIRYVYFCNDGYTRVGPPESQCLTGKWTGLETACRATTTPTSSTTTYIVVGSIAAVVVIVVAILTAILVKRKFYKKTTSLQIPQRQTDNAVLNQENGRPDSPAAEEQHYEAVMYDDVAQRPFLPLPRSTLYYEAPIVRPKPGEYLEIQEDAAQQRATHVAPYDVNIKHVNGEKHKSAQECVRI